MSYEPTNDAGPPPSTVVIREGGSAMKSAKIGLAALVVVGAIMAIGARVIDLPAKAQGVDNLTNSFRPAFRSAEIRTTREQMDTVKAMAAELREKTLPALAQALNMTPAELQGFLGSNFPAVAKGIGELDRSLPYFDNLVSGLEAHDRDFHLADAIPTKNLPATVVPWLFILPGSVAAILAFAALVRFRRLTGPALIAGAVFGVVLIVAPLLLSVPKKAQAVDNLTNAFRPAFTDAGARTARGYMDGFTAMATELQQKTLPALAQALNMTPAQLQGFLGSNFPAVAKGIGELPRALPRFEGLVRGIEQNVGNFRRADAVPTANTPTTLLHWLFELSGLGLLLSGGGALAAGALAARRQQAAQAAPTRPAVA
jgi:hypothetical protein